MSVWKRVPFSVRLAVAMGLMAAAIVARSTWRKFTAAVEAKFRELSFPR